MMAGQFTRRDTLKTALVAGAGYWTGVAGAVRAETPNEKLNVAVIGIGGQGRSNLNGLSSQNIVALCDLDEVRAGDAFQKFPKATRFQDYREMFDKMSNQIDAVAVSTPDHTHFHPAMTALQLSKHLYCEKPMAHSVWEIRQMTDLAAKQGVATQLGVQRHTLKNMHRVVELIQAGAIGKVSEVHCWVEGKRGMPAMPAAEPVPDHVNWDLWIGPAQPREFSSTICPYGWRFWWDYGTGEMGNWGCHILDIPYWALGLKTPQYVEASGPPVDELRTPQSMAVKYVFEASDEQPAVDLHWYHAENGPDILRELKLSNKGNNTLFIGSEGMLLCGFGQRKLLPEEKFANYTTPGESIPDSPGFHREFINACKGGEKATCDFSYSGPLSETVILGNVAYRAGSGFKWNSADLAVIANAAAEKLIKPTFRKGWEFTL
ncbi:MAG: Gfo/Idh/MocA family oxidoreductase [Planctomycetales bacterium]|nr:Gfo/Idh/MocA family oxidoreductase [Planctomycetales bacterium]MCA9167045.1 Gfo/Idh/MocA family oxidoreductase [Planctomycetales bacterium]